VWRMRHGSKSTSKVDCVQIAISITIIPTNLNLEWGRGGASCCKIPARLYSPGRSHVTTARFEPLKFHCCANQKLTQFQCDAPNASNQVRPINVIVPTYPFRHSVAGYSVDRADGTFRRPPCPREVLVLPETGESGTPGPGTYRMSCGGTSINIQYPGFDVATLGAIEIHVH
jgi:hypothetical protein